jgi:hypothetical protein
MIEHHILNNRHHAPRVLCDHCGAMIADAARANVLWPLDADGGDRGGIFFIHKACTWDYERAHAPTLFGADELDVWLVYLARNCGWDRQPAEGKARTLARLGLAAGGAGC